MDVRARKSRERDTSPGNARLYVHPRLKAFKKVQVLYYLCRNGQLEHPHFMEVSHLANQQLRLKDVMDRLTIVRGKGMPFLFSWSCKRNYKSGYVWNDLAENDVIYPSEGGGEYVLKGSELIEGCAERFQQLQVSNRQRNPESNFHPKRKPLVVSHHREREQDLVDYNRDEVDEEEDEEKGSNYSSHPPYNRCSRGVSTDEIIEEHEIQPKTHNINNNPTELSLDDASPPSTSSTVSEKARDSNNGGNSQRLEEDYSGSAPAAEPTMVARNKVLLHLIACGSSVATKGLKNTPCLKHQSSTHVRKSSNLHKGVLCKSATKIMEDEAVEINFMSENPRFGNPQSEEKEYFSGSIVESMTEDRVLPVEASLKKSSSYNQERSSKNGFAEAIMEEEEMKVEKKLKGKCIPRKKSSSKPTNK